MSTRTRTPKPFGEAAETETPVAEHEPNTLDVFIQHQRKAISEAAKAVEALLPKGVQSHTEAAIKESWEGYRNLVNSTLDDVIEFVKRAKIEETGPKEKL